MMHTVSSSGKGLILVGKSAKDRYQVGHILYGYALSTMRMHTLYNILSEQVVS